MQIDITAYYFAAGADSPTVVVQHGNNCNNRDNTVITAAFFLHSMGFNVITPNLRNHGDSGKTGRITWGQEEAYDTLGAWDYVVTDPEGKIGFAQRPEKTVLMGFSMGGLISRVAFALEPRIPALFTDSAHWNARNVLEWSINQEYPGLGRFFLPSAWFWAEHITGHDLDRLIPEKLFQREGDRRLLANIHATNDDIVPIQQSQDFIAYIKDTDFRVLQEWYEKLYGDDCEIHCRVHLQYPEKYKFFLCSFFSEVFDRTPEACGFGEGTSTLRFPTGIESTLRLTGEMIQQTSNGSLQRLVPAASTPSYVGARLREA
mmetsp:Transcript_9573/g.33932  ORF Transcript_9573/g.33932 Transcript_9573/m.33932 type:complete len:317 (+) Transcript_9573:237-1187(+)